MVRKKDSRSNKPIILGVSTLVAALLVLFALFTSQNENLRQREQRQAQERFNSFQSYAYTIFQENIAITQGIVSFLQIDRDEREIELFLSHITESDNELVRSISIIQDTTIRYVYPLEGNYSAIGRDLAEVPEQRYSVISAKETMLPLIQGPVHLLQGGSGFISRMPFEIDGVYWGQVGVVLDAGRLYTLLGKTAERASLQVALYHSHDSQYPFFQTLSPLSGIPLRIEEALPGTSWVADILPSNGWSYLSVGSFLTLLLGIPLSLFFSILIYKNLAAQEIMKRDSITDSLTGLYNRYFLEDCVKLLLERAKRNQTGIAVLMLDLDGFKAVNDSGGHKAGDVVLATIAYRLKTLCRGTEAIFRLGGDEFLILYPDLDSHSDIDSIVARIRKGVRQQIRYDNRTYCLDPSIGYSLFPEDGDNIDLLIQHADREMYIEKSAHHLSAASQEVNDKRIPYELPVSDNITLLDGNLSKLPGKL